MTKKQLSKEEFEYVLDNKVESYHHQAECFKRLYSMNMLSYEAIKGTLVRVYTSSDWFDSSFFLSIIRMVYEKDGVIIESKEDKKVFANLPEEVIVYRGMSDGAEIRPSFTLSMDVARKFAFDRNLKEKEGIVISSLVKKKDIMVYYNGREEEEVIIDLNNLMNTTIVQDYYGPTNRPYKGVAGFLDGIPDEVTLYHKTDRDTFIECDDGFGMTDGWSLDLKKLESEVLGSPDDDESVIVSVYVNRKYITKYDKPSETFTIDVEKAYEEDDDFGAPCIIYSAEELKFKNNLPDRVTIYNDVEREEYEDVVKGNSSWTDFSSGWKLDRSLIEESVSDDYDEDGDIIILSTEISKKYISDCRKTTCGFSINVDVESAMNDGNFVVPHIVGD